ncbi:MAG: PilZ domain-containing protein, partial [Deltaproteobacteria bacterium]
MPDKRRHERIDFLSTARLDYNGASHFCLIKNVSISGAMLLMKEPICPPIPLGNRCDVILYHDYEGFFSEDFTARIVYCQVPSFGVEFMEMEDEEHQVLKTIVDKEKRFLSGAQTIINMATEIAVAKGIQLSEVRFDNGKLAPEREVHCLRFSA